MKRKNIFAIALFLLISGMPLFLFTLLPVESLYNREIEVAVLNIIWLISVLTFTFFTLGNGVIIRTRLKPVYEMNKKQFKKLYLIVIAISLLGVVLSVFDRIVIRGLDYSQGFRAARYAWLQSTLEGNGGSLFSVIGHLSTPFSYCTLFLLLYHWEMLGLGYKLAGIISGYGVQFIMAMLNGGRSQILIMLVFSLAVLVMRRAGGRKIIPPFKHKYMIRLCIIFMGIGIVMYIKAIFFAFEKDTFIATNNTLEALGGKLTDQYIKSGGNDFFNLIIDMVAYLFHGRWTTELIMNYPISGRQGNSTFYIILMYMEKLHIIPRAEDRTIASTIFLTLQGNLYYDFGYAGVIIGGGVFGTLFGYAIKLIDKSISMLSGTQVLFIITIFVVMFGAPITPLYGLGGYVFIIYAMILMDIVTRMFFGRVSWTSIREDLN